MEVLPDHNHSNETAKKYTRFVPVREPFIIDSNERKACTSTLIKNDKDNCQNHLIGSQNGNFWWLENLKDNREIIREKIILMDGRGMYSFSPSFANIVPYPAPLVSNKKQLNFLAFRLETNTKY